MAERTPRVMILHAPGTNRDRDAALACTLAGGAPEVVPINDLLRARVRRLPDACSPGVLLRRRPALAAQGERPDHRFSRDLDAFIAAGKPDGICNGFQALVKAGYLGPRRQRSAGAQPAGCVQCGCGCARQAPAACGRGARGRYPAGGP